MSRTARSTRQPDRVVVAAVQASPVFLDLEATLAKALALTAEAASLGAKLIVFPEAFLAGYPYWLWGNDASIEQQAFVDLWDAAIDVPGPHTAELAAAAGDAGAVLMIGVNERESTHGRATLFNTLLTFDSTGVLVRRHRKIMPTYKERTVYGMGDGSGLPAVDSTLGQLGGLICWENFMPIARYHQYGQGVRIYTAVTVDDSQSWHNLMLTIAAEGRCFVVAAAQYFSRGMFTDHRYLGGFADDVDSLANGGSVVVEPGGTVLAGPL
ncbi:MAG: carbon-nitrogen hydrolase family protein, partial [Thermomicrobiales bacterium]